MSSTSRTIESAREIVAKAVEHGVWAWDDPNAVTDELVQSTADQLVGVAREASRNNSVNEAVLDILFAASVEPLSETSKQAYEQRFGSTPVTNGSAGAVPAASGAFAQPSPPPAPATAQPSGSDQSGSPAPAAGGANDSIEHIFPGYDDMKVADIKKAIVASAASGDLTEEEWQEIRAYEENHEERKTILSLQPEFKHEPEPAPAPANTGAFGSPQQTPSAVGQPPQAQADDDVSMESVYAGDATSTAQAAGLPIPPRPEFGPPVLPIQIDSTSDQELSRIATQFHSLFAHTQWLISQEEGRERAAEHLERESEREAFVHAYEMHKGAIPEEKQSQPTALEAARKQAERDAEHAEIVRTWRSRKVRHGIDARELKALSAGYDKAVWRINEELERRARLSSSRPS